MYGNILANQYVLLAFKYKCIYFFFKKENKNKIIVPLLSK